MLAATGNIGDIPIYTYPRLVGVSLAQPRIITCNHASLTGKWKVPNLSGGTMNRNKSLLDSLRPEAFDFLVDMEGKTFDGLLEDYTRLPGLKMEEEEGNVFIYMLPKMVAGSVSFTALSAGRNTPWMIALRK